MDDESVIDHVRKCAAVLDLVKEGQVGITVRTLEDVFYKKKVITNNIAVRNTDLYRFGNIYSRKGKCDAGRLFAETICKLWSVYFGKIYCKNLAKKYM